MTRRQWGWPVMALCALGCGGRVEEEAQSLDVGTPPRGFYSATRQTISDSCQPRELQSTTEELIGPTPEGVGVVFWQDHRQQAIPWDEPFTFTFRECGVTVTLAVLAKSSHSLVVDRQVDWVRPLPCPDLGQGLLVPSSDCSVHQITTYELEQACPSTRNGVTCQ